MYNDLNLENIMTDYQGAGEFNVSSLKLIDFGFATKRNDRQGGTGHQETVSKFRGCVLFSSVNQMNFKTTSPSDDLHSLCYLLVFLLNGGEPPFKYDKGRSLIERFNSILHLKTETSVADICRNEACKPLQPMVAQVFSLAYGQTPCYASYKHTLIECIHGISISPKFSTVCTTVECFSPLNSSLKVENFKAS